MIISDKIFGRVFIYDTGDPIDILLYSHQLIPMELGKCSDSDWAYRYFEWLQHDDFRQMFNLPETGNFQIIFSGKLSGGMSGYEYHEWDEQFDLDKDFKTAIIPDDWLMNIMLLSKKNKEVGKI